MARNDLFRISFFGGYNKEDVQEYIKSLENEIESVKLLHKREKDDLKRQLETAQASRGDSDRWVHAQKQWEEEKARLVRELEEARRENAELMERLTQFEQNGRDPAAAPKTVSVDRKDAQINAEMMVEKARHETGSLFPKAGKEAGRQKSELVLHINGELRIKEAD